MREADISVCLFSVIVVAFITTGVYIPFIGVSLGSNLVLFGKQLLATQVGRSKPTDEFAEVKE